MYTHFDGSIDIVPAGIDKSNLLNFIPYGAAIHYFGDSFNDLGIMQSPRITPHTVRDAEQEIKDLVLHEGGRIAQEPVGHGVQSILCNIQESLKDDLKCEYFIRDESKRMLREKQML
jgi:hydroxymethylpyrimidine pyrophosphatase-like HAD family hydrolase